MSFKKTLVLAVLLAGILAVIFKVQIPHREKEEKKVYAFADLDPQAIELIEIKNESGEFKLKNSKPGDANARANFEDWQLAEIPGSGLEAAVLNSLITSLQDLKLDSPLPKEDTEEDLAVYGLKDPAVSVRVKGKDLERQVLLGKNNPYLNKRYFKLADSDTVYLASGTLYGTAEKGANDFRDKTPMNFMDSQVKAISITNKTQSARVEKDENRKWRIVEPLKAPADEGEVLELTRNIRNLQVAAYIDDAGKKKEYKLDQPALEIRLEFEGREPIVLAFSTVDKKSYLYQQDAHSIFELTADPMKQVKRTAEDLRERKLFSFATDEAKAVEAVYEKGEKIQATKGEYSQWTVGGKEADDAFVEQWLTNLSELEASAFPDKEAAADFSQPRAKFTVTIEGHGRGDKVLSLTVGKALKGGNSYYTATGDLAEPFIIDQESYKKITLKEEALLPQKESEANPEQGAEQKGNH